MKRPGLFFCLFLFQSTAMLSQEGEDYWTKDSILFSKPSWGFGGGASMAEALKLPELPMAQNISPRSSFFVHAEAEYNYPLTPFFGLHGELRISCAPVRTRLELFRYPTNGLASDVERGLLSDYRSWYADLPLLFEFRRRGGKSHFQVFRLGPLAAAGYFPRRTVFLLQQEDGNGDTAHVFELELKRRTDFPVAAGLFASVGFAFTQKNHHLVMFMLDARYVFRPMLEGGYVFFRGSADETRGTAGLSGNYIGLKLGYTYTGEKRKKSR